MVVTGITSLGLFNLNPAELLVVGLVGILLFGRRLPEMGKSLGRTIVEFKKGLNSAGDEASKAAAAAGASEDAEPARRVEARPSRPVKQIASGTDEP